MLYDDTSLVAALSNEAMTAPSLGVPTQLLTQPGS